MLVVTVAVKTTFRVLSSMSTYSVVGVNNGVVTTQANGTRVRRVLITPLGQMGHGSAQVSVHVPPIIDKVLLKAVSKTAGKKDKIFTLRRIDTGKVTSCDHLKKLIKRQLRDDVVDWEEFDVGYTDSSKRGDKVISIRSIEDLTEVWREIKAHADMIQLWCDGLKVEGSSRKKRKKNNLTDEDSDDDHPKKKSVREEKEDKLKQALDTLKKKHESNYTPMQYRIWSELYANGMHTDLDTPPNNSMFKRAGSTTPAIKKKQTESTSPEMAEALTQAASQVSSAIVAAFTPRSVVPSTSSGTSASPAKVIENRSRCYKQLNDLQSLISRFVKRGRLHP